MADKLRNLLGINAPTSQSFLGYVLLAIVYGSIMLYRRSVIKVSLSPLGALIFDHCSNKCVLKIALLKFELASLSNTLNCCRPNGITISSLL